MAANPLEHVSLHLGAIGFVWLDIPIDIVTRLCFRPIKYLKYLGWAILDLEGAIHSGGQPVEDNAQLIPGGSYVYVVEDLALAVPVNLKVANSKRTESQTQTSPREAFRAALMRRDAECVFTGAPPFLGLRAVHIVPFARDEEGPYLLGDGGCAERGYSLNHSVNGFIAAPYVHIAIDTRRAAVLQTPNPMLSNDDVRQRLHPNRDPVHHSPQAKRYIFQWLTFGNENPDEVTRILPNCLLALFPDVSQPSPLLLHYMYGCTVLRLWGRNVDVLADSPRFAHGPPPAARMLGPSQTSVDYCKTIPDLEAGHSNNPNSVDLNSRSEEQDEEWHRTESGTWQRVRRFHDFDAVQDLVLELTLRGKPERRRALEAEKEEWESHMQAWVTEVNTSGVPPEAPQ
ncbi:hypothetical protein OE88DRAFT_1643861 [Heliocybe sulcata]|uniref:HNH nuclease domain-containing protein n=1 Tax=Heliocybe sulcata TaxID=5364 RepID=A0A5C3NB27_9AGAM|nr:hypothetical protein OE88DRAFT_1643861 [Heliocybe sulcata]